MSSKTKIVVLQRRKSFSTAIFIGLGILLITLTLSCSIRKRTPPRPLPTARTVHTGSMLPASFLAARNVNVEGSQMLITSILSASPLSVIQSPPCILWMAPITQLDQICQTQSLENLSPILRGSQYTSQALVGAIRTALGKSHGKLMRKIRTIIYGKIGQKIPSIGGISSVPVLSVRFLTQSYAEMFY